MPLWLRAHEFTDRTVARYPERQFPVLQQLNASNKEARYQQYIEKFAYLSASNICGDEGRKRASTEKIDKK